MPKGKHYRVTIHGHFGPLASPLERWQTSLNVDSDDTPVDGTPTNADLLARATAIMNAWTNGIGSTFQPNVYSTACDVRFIDSDGRQPTLPDGSFAGSVRYETPTPSGASGTWKYPPQTAIVASLVTARAGASGKGRLFLPATTYPLDSDGLISQANAETLRANVLAVINAVNAQWSATNPKRVSVMSSKGFASAVTGVRIGRALDTHRSRRRDLLERYTATGAVAP